MYGGWRLPGAGRWSKLVIRMEKLATEAPVNGGPNYEGPKVKNVASLRESKLYAGKSSSRSKTFCFVTQNLEALLLCPKGFAEAKRTPSGVRAGGLQSFALHATKRFYVRFIENQKNLGIIACDYRSSLCDDAYKKIFFAFFRFASHKNLFESKNLRKI